jgi:hypothetical protein
LVHPAIRELGRAEVVDARLAEEHRATDVLAHARHEESAEFPILRHGVDRDRLVSMAGAVRAAERIAPTPPPPGVESPAANFLLGPPLAIMDRARDAIRDALKR